MEPQLCWGVSQRKQDLCFCVTLSNTNLLIERERKEGRVPVLPREELIPNWHTHLSHPAALTCSGTLQAHVREDPHDVLVPGLPPLPVLVPVPEQRNRWSRKPSAVPYPAVPSARALTCLGVSFCAVGRAPPARPAATAAATGAARPPPGTRPELSSAQLPRSVDPKPSACPRKSSCGRVQDLRPAAPRLSPGGRMHLTWGAGAGEGGGAPSQP